MLQRYLFISSKIFLMNVIIKNSVPSYIKPLCIMKILLTIRNKFFDLKILS